MMKILTTTTTTIPRTPKMPRPRTPKMPRTTKTKMPRPRTPKMPRTPKKEDADYYNAKEPMRNRAAGDPHP
jgi:hypothetical protein